MGGAAGPRKRPAGLGIPCIQRPKHPGLLKTGAQTALTRHPAPLGSMTIYISQDRGMFSHFCDLFLYEFSYDYGVVFFFFFIYQDVVF